MTKKILKTFSECTSGQDLPGCILLAAFQCQHHLIAHPRLILAFSHQTRYCRSTLIPSLQYQAAARSSFGPQVDTPQRPSLQQGSTAGMLLSPSPAGHKLPPVQDLGSSTIQPPCEAVDQAESWDATSSKEEAGKKRQPCSFFLKTGNCAFGAE